MKILNFTTAALALSAVGLIGCGGEGSTGATMDGNVPVLSSETLDNGVVVEVLGEPGKRGAGLSIVGRAEDLENADFAKMSRSELYTAHTGRPAPIELEREPGYHGCGSIIHDKETFDNPSAWTGSFSTCLETHAWGCNTGPVGVVHYVVKKMGEIRRDYVLTSGWCGAQYDSDSVLAVTYTMKTETFQGGKHYSHIWDWTL